MHSDCSHWSMEPLKILVVSPFECMRENLCYALDVFSEATVQDALDRATALMRIGRMMPDLVIAEIDWRRGDALRLASDIRGGRTQLDPGTPIIFLTWRATFDRVLAVSYLGANALLLIPYTASLLQSRVVRVLERVGYKEAFRDVPIVGRSSAWMPQCERHGNADVVVTQAEIEQLLRPTARMLHPE